MDSHHQEQLDAWIPGAVAEEEPVVFSHSHSLSHSLACPPSDRSPVGDASPGCIMYPTHPAQSQSRLLSNPNAPPKPIPCLQLTSPAQPAATAEL